MLSFPKSHRYEGMIRFEFGCEERKPLNFLEKIKHRLARVDITLNEVPTEIVEVGPPIKLE